MTQARIQATGARQPGVVRRHLAREPDAARAVARPQPLLPVDRQDALSVARARLPRRLCVLILSRSATRIWKAAQNAAPGQRHQNRLWVFICRSAALMEAAM